MAGEAPRTRSPTRPRGFSRKKMKAKRGSVRAGARRPGCAEGRPARPTALCAATMPVAPAYQISESTARRRQSKPLIRAGRRSPTKTVQTKHAESSRREAGGASEARVSNRRDAKWAKAAGPPRRRVNHSGDQRHDQRCGDGEGQAENAQNRRRAIRSWVNFVVRATNSEKREKQIVRPRAHSRSMRMTCGLAARNPSATTASRACRIAFSLVA